MMLSKNNFYKSVHWFKRPGNTDIEGAIHTYEPNDAIYDIAIINKMKFYQKNMGEYSNRIDSIQPIHCAIEDHYGI